MIERPLHEPLGAPGKAGPEARWWFHRRGRQRGTRNCSSTSSRSAGDGDRAP